MKRKATLFYRWWRIENNQGLLENTPNGRFRHKRAQAICLLMIGLPLLVVLELDGMKIAHGGLWVATIAWSVGIAAVMLFQSIRTAARYYRQWWTARRR